MPNRPAHGDIAPVLLGYARVSTKAQDTATQRAALKRAGVRHIVEERRSCVASRPQLDALLADLRPGHVLVVYKIDRLARSLADLLRILDQVSQAGASFRSLTEPIDTTSPVGVMVVQMLGAIAQLERSMILERCAAGRAQAMAQGVRFGRTPRVDSGKVLALLRRGLTPREVGERLGCDRSTVSRIAAGHRRCDGGPGDHVIRTRKRVQRQLAGGGNP
jgi:DNA invertase Pin-like site-specific DNA recombinase